MSRARFLAPISPLLAAAAVLIGGLLASPAAATQQPPMHLAASAATFTVTEDGVNIRSGPATVFGVVGGANIGTRVVAECWSRLDTHSRPFVFGRIGSTTGYISQDFTTARPHLIGTLIDACPGTP